MALEPKDIEVFRVLLREELQPFRDEVDERFREVFGHFDELYRRDETRKQEYTIGNKQLVDHEERITQLEKKVA
jgi:hypothetical protein